MAVKAYLLIEVEVGKTTEVIEAVQKVGGVSSADSVTGPYDVIAAVEAAELDALDRVIKNIHSAGSIDKVTTCVWAESLNQGWATPATISGTPCWPQVLLDEET